MKNTRPPAKPKKDYKKLSDTLLKLLFSLRHDPRSGYQDMVMRSEHGTKLDALLKRERRYEWRRVGATEHLYDLGTNPPTSIAYYLPSGNSAHWHILGRKSFDGVARSVKEAKSKVEYHFETLNEQE